MELLGELQTVMMDSAFWITHYYANVKDCYKAGKYWKTALDSYILSGRQELL